jgi:hypothetical protein
VKLNYPANYRQCYQLSKQFLEPIREGIFPVRAKNPTGHPVCLSKIVLLVQTYVTPQIKSRHFYPCVQFVRPSGLQTAACNNFVLVGPSSGNRVKLETNRVGALGRVGRGFSSRCLLCVQRNRIHYCGLSGRDSSVGIATSYGLDGPGIESQRWRDFPHLSTPALGSTQTPIQCVPGLSLGGKAAGAWR